MSTTGNESLILTCFACGKPNRVPRERLAQRPKCGACGAPLADGKVHEVDLATLEKAARNDSLPILADFWASWCGPCRMMAPEFEKAAAQLAGEVRLVKVNTERHPDAAIRYNIRGIPALLLFAGGREAARQAGAMPAQSIVAFARQALARAA
ncbi:MAG: thioredoxin TrxC [Alphaproteobacteria bacterium]|nr:MAG: thioredoxin TrxC [Alphaproteobacteria bacterium]